jgi:DNA repair protein RadC
MAVLLGSGVQGKDVRKLSKEIIAKFDVNRGAKIGSKKDC